MEAGEYGLTRGTCFVARRLEVVAVAGLLRILWCVLGAVGIFCVCLRVRVRVCACVFPICFFFGRTRPAASMRPSYLIFLSTSIGVPTGFHYLPSLSVCVYV